MNTAGTLRNERLIEVLVKAYSNIDDLERRIAPYESSPEDYAHISNQEARETVFEIIRSLKRGRLELLRNLEMELHPKQDAGLLERVQHLSSFTGVLNREAMFGFAEDIKRMLADEVEAIPILHRLWRAALHDCATVGEPSKSDLAVIGMLWTESAVRWQEMTNLTEILAFSLEHAAGMAVVRTPDAVEHAFASWSASRADAVATTVGGSKASDEARPLNEPNQEDVLPRPPLAPRPKSKRGPKPNIESHRQVLAVVEKFNLAVQQGEQHGDWRSDDNLALIAEQLDRLAVPFPKQWRSRKPMSRSWVNAVDAYPRVVVQAIEHRLKQG